MPISALVDRASDGEVELAAVGSLVSRNLVEAIAPVKAQQTKHREVDTGTDTGRAVHFEGIEVLESQPTVTRLHETHGINGGCGVERQRITQFHSIFGEDVTTNGNTVTTFWGKGLVLIAPHTYNLTAVEVIVSQTVTAKIETMERRGTYLLVIIA